MVRILIQPELHIYIKSGLDTIKPVSVKKYNSKLMLNRGFTFHSKRILTLLFIAKFFYFEAQEARAIRAEQRPIGLVVRAIDRSRGTGVERLLAECLGKCRP